MMCMRRTRKRCHYDLSSEDALWMSSVQGWGYGRLRRLWSRGRFCLTPSVHAALQITETRRGLHELRVEDTRAVSLLEHRDSRWP